MIAFLRGRVFDKHPNRIIVDVNGVGYEVHVPLSTYYDVGDAGAEIALRVHMHVREDALQLYGFITPLEQVLFERLIGISGIGPKLAIAVLSGIDSRELVVSVQRADVARLTSIPGIGKKTAERMVLELRDKLPEVSSPAAPSVPTLSATQEDVLSALLNLGYQRASVEKAISGMAGTGDAANFDQMFRTALGRLSK